MTDLVVEAVALQKPMQQSEELQKLQKQLRVLSLRYPNSRHQPQPLVVPSNA
jgi:hypothetical protein